MQAWHIRFPLVPDALPQGFSYADGILSVSLRFTLPDAPPSLAARMSKPLTLSAPCAPGDSITLACTPAHLTLSVGGILMDEEWPVGYAILPFPVSSDVPEQPPFSPATVTSIAGYRPPRAHIGDCMPYVHDGIFRLYCLYDRRHHGSKWGLGAHQWTQLSSSDLRTWTTHPLAVAIDDPREGSICTGSVFFHNGAYHAFFAVRMCDGSPAELTSAVSADGVRFEKTHRVFTLSAPYDAPSARDPKVYENLDGSFSMLVTTSVTRGGEKYGCLARLTSPNLEDWTVADPLLVMPDHVQPECPDCFAYRNHYYLVFSRSLTAHYLISDTPTGPWRKPDGDDTIAGGALKVPKAAVFHDRLIFVGWEPEGGGWGGIIRIREAFADADGKLSFRELTV